MLIVTYNADANIIVIISVIIGKAPSAVQYQLLTRGSGYALQREAT